MIEVIKPGRYKIDRYRYTCTNCSCEFEYSSGDIGKLAQKGYKGMNFMLGIQCPCCKSLIAASSLVDGSMQLTHEYMETTGGYEVEIEQHEVDRLHQIMNESLKKVSHENNGQD